MGLFEQSAGDGARDSEKAISAKSFTAEAQRRRVPAKNPEETLLFFAAVLCDLCAFAVDVDFKVLR
jgi:hypothetical protein